MNKQTKYLTLLNAGITLFIAAAAFILSFDAIRELAESNGIKPSLSWLVPLIIDGAMIAFSVNVLKSSLANERRYWGWSLIVTFVILSVVFNIAHSNGRILGMALAALPPLSLLATFETLMSQIKSAMRGRINYLADKWRRRSVVLLSLAKQWRQTASEYHQEIVRLASELDTALQAIDKERLDHDKTRERLAAMKEEYSKVKQQLVTDAVPLDKLPPRLADYVTEVSNGVTPNGDYSEKWDIGVSTLNRANSMFLNG